MSLFSVQAYSVSDTLTASQSPMRGADGYVSLGYRSLDVTEINQRLQQSTLAYPTISDQYFTIGGGGHAINGPWLVGGNGYGIMGTSQQSNAYEVEVTGGAGFFNVGYRFLQRSSVFAGPILGIGGGGMEMRVSPVSDDPSFGEVIDQPERQSTLSSSSFLLKTAFGVVYEVPRFSRAAGKNGQNLVTLHLRAGYTFALSDSEWSMADRELAGSPTSGMQGPFLRLMVGFGGYGY